MSSYVFDIIWFPHHTVRVRWVVEIGDEFEPEFDGLDDEVQTEILALSRLLQRFGPQLGRPRVDTLKRSRHANMRPSESAEEEAEVAMAVNVDAKIRKLSSARRKKVEARAAELIAEEMTLRELRRARRLTQVRMAEELGITQDSVSRLEKRSDLLLSTLRKTVKAMGGNLSLVAEFPDRPPVVLSGVAEDKPPLKPTGRKTAHLCT